MLLIILICLTAVPGVLCYKGLETTSVFQMTYPVQSKLKRWNNFNSQSQNKLSSPHVICTEKTIGIQFNKGQFSGGRIFASRFEDDPSCVRYVANAEEESKFELPIQFMPCGLKSKRLTYPTPGIEYTLNVVVSYDHSRMTEDDELYNLVCRYFAHENSVGTVMEIAPYSKTYLIGDNNTPNCHYSLHINSLGGPTAENAQLGENVYHEWKCETHTYAIKVYECYVHDGNNRRYMLIDENGCSKDPSIMPELTYDANLNLVYAQSKVFKFSDSNKMHFNCLLYMCPKNDVMCKNSVPPSCGSNKGNKSRGKRFSSLRNGVHELMLNSSTPFRQFRDLQKNPIQIQMQLNEKAAAAAAAAEAEREAEMKEERLNDKPIVVEEEEDEREALVLPPEQPRISPIIHYETSPTPKQQSSSSTQQCPDEGYGRTAFIILIICNVITLTIATVSLFILNRKRFSEKLSVTE